MDLDPDAYRSLSAEEIAAAVRARAVSAVDVVTACLARLGAVEPYLHAFTEVWGPQAMRRAREVDARVAAGERPALAGVPIAVKGRHGLRAAAALIDAGCVPVGATSVPGPGTPWQTWGLGRHGRTVNPWRADRTPGGSSAGAAAAVAAGVVPVATGADGAGSVRIPAAWCGVFGLKTTNGRLPSADRTGLAAAGVLTRHASDLAAYWRVVSAAPAEAAPVPGGGAPPPARRPTPTAPAATTTPPRAPAGAAPAGDAQSPARRPASTPGLDPDSANFPARDQGCPTLRPGTTPDAAGPPFPDAAPGPPPHTGRARPPHTDDGGAPGAPRAAGATSAASARCVPVEAPEAPRAPAPVAALWSAGLGFAGGDAEAEAVAAVAYGAVERLVRAGVVRLVPGDVRLADPGPAWLALRAPGAGPDAAGPVRAANDRRLAEVFARCELLLTPVTPNAPHGHAGPGDRYSTALTWAFNLSGHPAASVPAGLGPDGCPVGLHLVARHGAEPLLLAVARAAESRAGLRSAVPPELP
ncbi:amidase family protein [Streptomyces sp. NPDC054842]